jgi:hypothetical protein
MKETVRWLVLVVALLCTGACKKGVIDYYTTGIVLENYDNCGDFIKPAGSAVNNGCYVIRVNYTSDQTSFNGVNDNDRYNPANHPTSVLIYSLQAFNAQHPAGSSLNEYFIAGPKLHASAEDIVTGFADTEDFYPTHDPDELWLMQPPEWNGSYSFVLRMEFNDGVVVSDTTTVNLN